jgi:peptide/nickel transport system substrate-binding protein
MTQRRTVLALGRMLAIIVAAWSTVSPTSAAGTRGQGGELKILYWQAPVLLNPQMSTDGNNLDPARLVIEPLASWDKQGKPLANGLAAEIPTLTTVASPRPTSVTWARTSGGRTARR